MIYIKDKKTGDTVVTIVIACDPDGDALLNKDGNPVVLSLENGYWVFPAGGLAAEAAKIASGDAMKTQVAKMMSKIHN
jgi:hypothetical protein